MMEWTLAKYKGNANRVSVTGTPSRAMITNVICGAYPDLFAAGSAFAGVAFGCFAGNGYDVWNSACATGQAIKTGADWKAIVPAAYPGYSGYRPKMQAFHSTADTTLYHKTSRKKSRSGQRCWIFLHRLSKPSKTHPLADGWGMSTAPHLRNIRLPGSLIISQLKRTPSWPGSTSHARPGAAF